MKFTDKTNNVVPRLSLVVMHFVCDRDNLGRCDLHKGVLRVVLFFNGWCSRFESWECSRSSLALLENLTRRTFCKCKCKCRRSARMTFSQVWSQNFQPLLSEHRLTITAGHIPQPSTKQSIRSKFLSCPPRYQVRRHSSCSMRLLMTS